MAKRGRKGKMTTREPNGRPQRMSEEQMKRANQMAVAAQPHRAWLRAHNRPDGPDMRLAEKASTPIGAASLTGTISESEYQAALRLQDVVRRYRAVISSPDPLMHPAPGSGKDIAPEEALRRRRDHDEASGILWNAGKLVFEVTRAVVIFEQPLPPGRLSQLRSGLQLLALHWGFPQDWKPKQLTSPQT